MCAAARALGGGDGHGRSSQAQSRRRCVRWLFVCLAGWLGLALKVSAHPPPPSPSVPLYPLPGLSLCPRLSWGRGMLLPAGVTVNPVGRRPSSSHSLQSRPSPTPPTPQPSAPYATVLGCILQQLKGTEVTPGNPQMHQKLGLGPVALGGIHSSAVRPPIRSGPQGRKREGVPLAEGGGRGVPWQEGKWKEKLGSTRAGGQAASGPPGQAAVTRAHWCAGLVCAWVGLTPGYSWGAAGVSPQGQVRERRGPAEGSALHPGPDPTPWRSSPGPQAPPPGPSLPPQGQMFSWRRHRLGEGC